MFTNRFTASPLTLDHVREAAPSAFATAPYAGMSARYAQISTADVLQALMREGFQPFAAKQSVVRIDDKQAFAKHMIRLRQVSSAVAVNDVFPEVVLVNSHDGSSAYKLMGGLFRLVCSNGLIVADSLLAAQKIRHTGNVIDQVVQGTITIVKEMPRTIDAVARWKQIQLNREEQMVMAEAAHYLRFADAEGTVNTPIRPEQLLAVRRREDSASDLWSTFNHVQENVIRGGLRARDWSNAERRGRRVTTREVKGIDQDVKLNRALWTITEKMAQLKGGLQ
jgi:hypothetical protein